MSKKNEKRRSIVKLLKFINGTWQVVDYGIPEKTAIYTALGYVVEREERGAKVFSCRGNKKVFSVPFFCA